MTDTEKAEFRNIAKQTEELYDFIEKEKLLLHSRIDAERFMALNFIPTIGLLKESISLSRLTKWLIGITVVLGILTLVQVFILIITVP